MITACRANSTGDAVNHSLVDCLSDAFSVLCLFFPGLVVHTVVITVIVHVAGVAGVAYLLVPCSAVFFAMRLALSSLIAGLHCLMIATIAVDQ